MCRQIVTFCIVCLSLCACDDSFIMETPEAFLTTATWQKKNFWIDAQSIVFDMVVHFKEDNTFEMQVSLLDKKDTSYNIKAWTGTWHYSKVTNQLELSYEKDMGIIGYYMGTIMEKEMYQLELENDILYLWNQTEGQEFELELVKE